LGFASFFPTLVATLGYSSVVTLLLCAVYPRTCMPCGLDAHLTFTASLDVRLYCRHHRWLVGRQVSKQVSSHHRTDSCRRHRSNHRHVDPLHCSALREPVHDGHGGRRVHHQLFVVRQYCRRDVSGQARSRAGYHKRLFSVGQHRCGLLLAKHLGSFLSPKFRYQVRLRFRTPTLFHIIPQLHPRL
jgi:hypothetical protein